MRVLGSCMASDGWAVRGANSVSNAVDDGDSDGLRPRPSHRLTPLERAREEKLDAFLSQGDRCWNCKQYYTAPENHATACSWHPGPTRQHTSNQNHLDRVLFLCCGKEQQGTAPILIRAPPCQLTRHMTKQETEQFIYSYRLSLEQRTDDDGEIKRLSGAVEFVWRCRPEWHCVLVDAVGLCYAWACACGSFPCAFVCSCWISMVPGLCVSRSLFAPLSLSPLRLRCWRLCILGAHFFVYAQARLSCCFLTPLRDLAAEIEAQGTKLQAIRLARLQDPLGGEFTAEDQAEAMARLKALKASVRALRHANAQAGATEVAGENSVAAGGGQDAEVDMSRCSSSATAVAPVLGGRH